MSRRAFCAALPLAALPPLLLAGCGAAGPADLSGDWVRPEGLGRAYELPSMSAAEEREYLGEMEGKSGGDSVLIRMYYDDLGAWAVLLRTRNEGDRWRRDQIASCLSLCGIASPSFDSDGGEFLCPVGDAVMGSYTYGADLPGGTVATANVAWMFCSTPYDDESRAAVIFIASGRGDQSRVDVSGAEPWWR